MGGGARADAFVLSPAAEQLGQGRGTTSFPGYRWSAADVDAVMARHAVGDAVDLVKTAVAMDNGDRSLNLRELESAARAITGARHSDLRWSPSVLADIMKQTGVASETALLSEARRHDDGDRVLSAAELESAATVLTRTLSAHDVKGVVQRVTELAATHGLTVETLGHAGGHPIQAVHVPATGGTPRLRVLVTGGVHGDEPCGTSAAMLLLEQLVKNPAIRKDTEFLVVPLVNPRGLEAHTRRTPEGVDLNRTFSASADAPGEVAAVGRALHGRSFDLALDLHSGGAGRNGFWVLHKDSRDLMEPAVDRFARHWPVLTGDVSTYNMTGPGVGESTNPNTLKDFAGQHGTRWTVTVEAPGSLSYLDQVFGQNDLCNQIIVEAHRRSAEPVT